MVGTTHFAGIVVGSGGFGILADRQVVLSSTNDNQ